MEVRMAHGGARANAFDYHVLRDELLQKDRFAPAPSKKDSVHALCLANDKSRSCRQSEGASGTPRGQTHSKMAGILPHCKANARRSILTEIQSLLD
jgi:hypothetical protein